MITTKTKIETREVPIYVTSDGKEFRDSFLAEHYERELSCENRSIKFTFTGEIRCIVKVPRNASPDELEDCVRKYFVKNIYCGENDDADGNLDGATNVICTGFTDITKF